MNKKLLRIFVGFLFFLTAIFIPVSDWAKLCLYVISYVVSGGEVVYRAAKNLFRGNVFDENFLMSIATVGAVAIGEYPEAVAVMLFYQVGELFQNYAVGKSRKSIAQLMNIRPDYANIIVEDAVTKVNPYEVKVGDRILIRPSEKVPLDCRVLSGSSSVDTSSLTGESIPRDVAESDELLSGFVNLSGPLTAEVLKEFGESTVNKILDLVENASAKKSTSENFITRFAAVYTPLVVIAAVLLAVVPPLLSRSFNFGPWIYRALTFLVVSCPCALVISVPLSFFGGIGGASRKGILVKGAEYLELLSKSETVVFDKTGTLTQGVFYVEEIQPVGISREELLFLAAYAEAYSIHPISVAVRQAYGKEPDLSKVENLRELPGMGILCQVDGKSVAVGNQKLMEQRGIVPLKSSLSGTVIYVAVDGVYCGYIHIADRLKPDAKETVALLKSDKIHRIALLTGDRIETANAVAKELGLDLVYAELLPGDKVEKVEELLSQNSKKGTLVFVGDGVNDAPVLKRSDVGIAMGGMGSDAAMEAADVVIMTDEPSKIHIAIRIARKTVGIARQNILLALSVKGVVLLLGAFGFASMWAAVFADVGVALLAVLNALRALGTRNL